MSTRSFVGSVDSTGTFRARYVHWDGYPTAMGKTLATMIARDGVLPVLDVLTEQRPGWSSLLDSTPDITRVDPDPEAPLGSAAALAADFGPCGRYRDGGVVNVPGYGCAYAVQKGGDSLDNWITGTLDPERASASVEQSTWCEWGYLLSEDTLYVVRCDAHPVLVTQVPLDRLAQVTSETWVAIECGEQFEECSHYAWFHDETVPEESKGLTMREWLGVVPMTVDRAIAVIDHLGNPTKVTRSGYSRGNTWHARTKDGSAVPLYTVKGNTATPLPDLVYVYPKRKEDMAESGVATAAGASA